MDLEALHKDGSIIRHRVSTTSLRDNSGVLVAIVGFAHAVSAPLEGDRTAQEAKPESQDQIQEGIVQLLKMIQKLKLLLGKGCMVKNNFLQSETRYHRLFEDAPIAISEEDRTEVVKYIKRLRAGGVNDFRSYLSENFEEAVKIASMARVIAINRLGREMTGISSAEEFTERYEEIIRSGDPESVIERALAVAEWMPRVQAEYDISVPGNRKARVLGTWCVLSGGDDAPARVWVSNQDISNLRRAEQALQESEDRFRTVLNAAEDCIFIKDKEHRYTFVNPAMTQLLEMPQSQIVGKSDSDLFGRFFGARVKALESKVLAGENVENEQTMMCRQDPLTLSFVRFPLRDVNGEVTGLCGIVRDITDRKEKLRPVSGKMMRYGSPAMRETLDRVLAVAKTDTTVLFLGESGSGKDYLARFLHIQSRRSGGPFLTINCPGLSYQLIESELFGHEAGSFTGARGRKRGLVELAEGGTVLLNEVGELPHSLQAKFLTFLDTQTFTRLGGEKEIIANTRIVAATNRDLAGEVKRGTFRQDLYYRLNVFPIRTPSLRERMEDLPLLARELLEYQALKLGLTGVPEIDTSALKVLTGYSWPGNVRELSNVLERALILGGSKTIKANDLGLGEARPSPEGCEIGISCMLNVTRGRSMSQELEQAKRHIVSEGLRLGHGSIKEAAALLGISRNSLVHHMKQLGVHK